MSGRRKVVLGALAVAGLSLAAVAVADPFGGPAPSKAAGIDNAVATSVAAITRRDLSSQTQVSATLGYADASSIAVPSGTTPSNVLQAQQSVASARATFETARTTAAADRTALAHAQAVLSADRRKQAIDCGGAGAADSSSSGSGTSGPCATVSQGVATDEQTAESDKLKAEADARSAAAAQTTLAGAEETLSAAETSASAYGQTSVYTALPSVGEVIQRGRQLYAIDGRPVLLLYGDVTPWRAFAAGMSPGRDIEALNANLKALGYGHPVGNAFTSETGAAIRALQAAHGLAETAELPLGSVVFEDGAIRVTAVTPARGAVVQSGTVLQITSTRREVTIDLDASQQKSIKVGDPVTITLPDNSTTPGHVSYVGTVATKPSGSDSSTPTIEVDVTPDRPAETGRLDQAPVDVSITTDTVRGVLTVPVNALLALASGGYALEEIKADGTHGLVAVDLGLFDDSEGLVEVSGRGLAAGQRVVVPSS